MKEIVLSLQLSMLLKEIEHVLLLCLSKPSAPALFYSADGPERKRVKKRQRFINLAKRLVPTCFISSYM